MGHWAAGYHADAILLQGSDGCSDAWPKYCCFCACSHYIEVAPWCTEWSIVVHYHAVLVKDDTIDRVEVFPELMVLLDRDVSRYSNLGVLWTPF